MAQLVSAITKLRSALGDTQRGFANRLGLSLRAVCNYETGRYPSKAVLGRLASLAAKHRFDDLAKTFSGAYAAEVKGQTEPGTAEETAWVRAVLAIVRNKEVIPNWPTVAINLVTALEKLVAISQKGGTVKTDAAELEEILIEARYQIKPSAEQQLESLARERSSRTAETFEQAYRQVLFERPDLYEQYLAAREAAAKGTRFERTMRAPKKGKKK